MKKEKDKKIQIDERQKLTVAQIEREGEQVGEGEREMQAWGALFQFVQFLVVQRSETDCGCQEKKTCRSLSSKTDWKDVSSNVLKLDHSRHMLKTTEYQARDMAAKIFKHIFLIKQTIKRLLAPFYMTDNVQ